MTERTYPPHEGVHLSTGRSTILGPEPGWFAWMKDHHSTLWCSDADDARERRDEALAEAARWDRVASAIQQETPSA